MTILLWASAAWAASTGTWRLVDPSISGTCAKEPVPPGTVTVADGDLRWTIGDRSGRMAVTADGDAWYGEADLGSGIDTYHSSWAVRPAIGTATEELVTSACRFTIDWRLAPVAPASPASPGSPASPASPAPPASPKTSVMEPSAPSSPSAASATSATSFVAGPEGTDLVATVRPPFKVGTAELLPEADDVLRPLVGLVGGRAVVVRVHSDSQGPDAFNLAMSQKRADAIVAWLVAHGVPAEHVRGVGAGETEPIADNLTAEGRATNRRVEVRLDVSR